MLDENSPIIKDIELHKKRIDKIHEENRNLNMKLKCLAQEEIDEFVKVMTLIDDHCNKLENQEKHD